MAIDLSVNPYDDDFNADKNYHRILFKPSYAVQARELTQSQTILQNQISSFGKNIFAEGSIVTGGQTPWKPPVSLILPSNQPIHLVTLSNCQIGSVNILLIASQPASVHM